MILNVLWTNFHNFCCPGAWLGPPQILHCCEDKATCRTASTSTRLDDSVSSSGDCAEQAHSAADALVLAQTLRQGSAQEVGTGCRGKAASSNKTSKAGGKRPASQQPVHPPKNQEEPCAWQTQASLLLVMQKKVQGAECHRKPSAFTQ